LSASRIREAGLEPPGAKYAYSGGSYEVVEALIADATSKSSAEVAKERVFGPLRMSNSAFSKMPPRTLAARVARGHTSDGKLLPGGWRVMPELAAAGVWSTSEDLARVLLSIIAGYNGRPGAILARTTIDEMITPQGSGPYGLGAAISGSARDIVLMKRGQNVGY
jgi:CubicO group peptidase (beta-lactamase class C family)